MTSQSIYPSIHPISTTYQGDTTHREYFKWVKSKLVHFNPSLWNYRKYWRSNWKIGSSLQNDEFENLCEPRTLTENKYYDELHPSCRLLWFNSFHCSNRGKKYEGRKPSEPLNQLYCKWRWHSRLLQISATLPTAVSTHGCLPNKRHFSHEQNKVFALSDTLTFFFPPWDRQPPCVASEAAKHRRATQRGFTLTDRAGRRKRQACKSLIPSSIVTCLH